nr:ABC transporter G family member 14 [Ipomoea batatas]
MRGLRQRRYGAFNRLLIFQVLTVAFLAGLLWWQTPTSHIANRVSTVLNKRISCSQAISSFDGDLSVVAFELGALEVVVVVPVDNSIHSDKEDGVDMDDDMAVEHKEDSFEVHPQEVDLHEVVDSHVEASLDVED